MRHHVPDTRPGGRLPRAWVSRDGHRVPTLDLVPPDRYVPPAGSQAWAEAGTSLGGGPLTLEAVLVGTTALDPDGLWDAVSGLDEEGAVLDPSGPTRRLAHAHRGGGAGRGAALRAGRPGRPPRRGDGVRTPGTN